MSSMTGINMFIGDAKRIANECLAGVNQRRAKLLQTIDKQEKEWLNVHPFIAYFRKNGERMKNFEFRRRLVFALYVHEEKIARDILATVEYSASAYIYVATADLGDMKSVS